jgi:hypothetical protein
MKDPIERLWPPVDTPERARAAVKQAFWAAIFVAGMTTFIVLVNMFVVPTDPRLQTDAFALIDAAMFAVIAYGLYHHSRTAAVAGLAIYLGEQGYALSLQPPRATGLIVASVIMLAFIGGIRGAFALTSEPRLERPRLNGWQRLWIVTATAWVLLVLLVAIGLVAEQGAARSLEAPIPAVILGVTVVPPAVLYLTGVAVAWIRRGFRSA